MIRIEIESTEVKQRGGISNGREWKIRAQQGWAFLCDQAGQPNRHPTRIEVRIDEGQQPYAAGVYTLSPASFWADKYGKLTVSPRLVPVAANVKAAA
ncbi:Helix-destabilising protein [Ralstonia sp. 25mfcol4.1]|uniref:single-stranded DNA-binding protein n=1 Tax=Ralstonia sp. 25mfcol4.1 TaxID=1761899 RepID=UPI000881C3AF|nr:single-stranded DNA-binding protein [Ralstonia sp. 25mfcol4.1]SDP38492.1 Helix-destabilising protein [Ralstonia sp. 25mfcol4.1]